MQYFNSLYNIFMLGILTTVIVVLTAATWPVFFVRNFRFLYPQKLIFKLSALLIIIDQWSKSLILSNFRYQESIPVIRDFFHLTYVRNSGAAFGFFQGRTILFIAVAFMTIFIVVLYVRTLREHVLWMHTALAFLVSGAVGNLIDRIRFNYVVDFLDFRIIRFPVFNIADIMIDIGVGMLIWAIFRFEDSSCRNDEMQAESGI